ncbi:2-pyrone-4,6-dicarbaxylate hydrolase [Aquimixticola soesokkakensis]|uniref:2-pyrone-4,6-dicarboxylate lactonase n=1 Tax=Aquimixticola soesokkakensis TaxID=1519096 RepID=A0A1Y5SU25_9RHOB|nr:amidohydrolase family protein [Aquimixticola soesokkakensis]SLN45089.1 2-pyrone-4,6-dicarbaxylate hydrolase [Aquimixticola soesokkakensis]
MPDDMKMDADWLVFHPNPKKPDFKLPAGAVDAHCHVFGPAGEFPFAPERKYTPCDAGKDKLYELRDYLGFARNVIVQATCHGKDNRAMVDACRTAGDLARGIASVGPDITEAEIAQMDAAGVRGVRFNFVKRLVDATPKEVFLSIAEKIAKFDWHIVVYFEAADLEELVPFLNQLPTTIVVDHMGRPDVAKGVDHPDFQRFIKLMEDNPRVWSKVTCPERLSVEGEPDYSDVIPFCRTIVEKFPDRVLWGTDWPHPNMKTHMPDDGNLVDFIPKIAPTAELQQQLLVDNPMRLYWAK